MISTTLKVYPYPEVYIKEDWGDLTSVGGVQNENLGTLASTITNNEDWGSLIVTESDVDSTNAINNREIDFGRDEAVERSSYSYNDRAIILVQTPEDYGGIASTVTQIEDYGSIAQSPNQVGDWKYIYFQNSAFPYGTATLNGSAVSEFNALKIAVGFGSIRSSGAAIQKNTESWIGLGTAVFSGDARFKNNESFAGTGTAIFSGIAVEKNEESYIGLGTFRSLSGSAEVLGSNPPDSIILGTFSGAAVPKNTESWIGLGTAVFSGSALESFEPNPPENTLLGTFSGDVTKRRSYSYNELSISGFEGYVDYGLITNVIDEGTDDYGNVVSLTDPITVDYGDIGIGATTYPYGTINVSGAAEISLNSLAIHIGSGTAVFSGIAVEKNEESYIGLGTFSTFSGSAEVLGVNPPDSTVLGTFTGIAIEKNSESYVGFGTANFSGIAILKNNEAYAGFGTANFSGIAVEKNEESWIGLGTVTFSGSALESFESNPPEDILLGTFSGDVTKRRSYSYNELAVVFFEGYVDYGLITNVIDEGTDDYGTVNTIPDSIILDYGDIGIGATTYPYGTINVSGAAEISLNSLAIHIGSGTAVFSGIAVEKNEESWIGLGTATFSGTSADSSKNIFIGLGTFNSLSGSAEVLGVNSPDSTVLGTFTGAAVLKNTESYPGTGTPVLSGAAAPKNIESYIGSGTLSAIRGAAEVLGVNPPENTVLGSFSGDVTKRRSYSYNELAIVDFEGYVDYGLITNVIDEGTDDYGTINASADSIILDYGDIGIGATTYPYGTINVSGAAEISLNSLAIHIGSGTISISGSVDEVLNETAVYAGLGTITVFGTSADSSKNIFIGLGTFNSLSGSAEVLGVNSPDSTVLGTFTGAAVPKNTESWIGLGTVTFSGSARESFIPRTEIGSGTLSAIRGAAEVLGVNPPEDILLGTFSGDVTKRRSYSYNELAIVDFEGYVDYGLITNIVDEGTDDYGTVDTIPDSIILDYGDIGIGATTYPYGTINVSGAIPINRIFTPLIAGSGTLSAIRGAAEVLCANSPDDTVLLSISGSSREVFNKSTFIGFGTANFSGIAVEKNEESWIGLGTARFSGGATVPKNTEFWVGLGTAVFSGTARESFIPRTEIGSGTIPVSGAAEINLNTLAIHIGSGTANFSGTSIEKNEESWIGLGTAIFSGTSIEKNSESYIGLGTFGALRGAAEVLGVNPPEDILLGTFSGSALEKNKESYIGSGTANFSGTSIEKNSESWIGLGTARFSGTSIEKNSESYAGTGTATFSGTARESFIPRTEIGSGTLNALSGSAEVLGVNPPENTVLFELNGGYTNLKALYSHRGSGTLSVSGEGEFFVQGLSIDEGSGTATFSGTARESFIPRTEIGSGTLSAIRGAAEVLGVNPPENTVLGSFSGTSIEKNTESWIGLGTAVFSGTSIEKNTESYIGLGTLSAINGSAEILSINSPDSIAIIELSGTKIEKRIFKIIGFGTFFAFAGSAEVLGANPPEDTVLGTFSGTKVERSSFNYYGSGIVNIDGTSQYKSILKNVGVGSAVFSGSVNESFIPTTAIGSGLFSAFSGSAESFNVNPPENTVLGVFSGTKDEKTTFRQVGSGSLNVLGSMSQNIQVYVPSIIGSGGISLVNASASSYIINIVAEEIIGITGSGNESFIPTTEIGNGVIVVTGFGTERTNKIRFARVYGTII